MSYQVLSRKWRPKTFEDVVGQEHVTTSLVNALKKDRLGHAYLFTGTRGVGKTSAARIFSKAIRCLNLNEDGSSCNSCTCCEDFQSGQSLDVIEIDGASNNSVDNIRELINNVQFLPSTGEKRVYVIDEVHMLSTSAFNALLKTLEEPPAHIVFIFATTEPEKIPDTVLSRCQRFDFRSPGKEKLSLLIKKIANEEGISFENENIVDKICTFGKGSIRDSLSIFDQLLAFSSDKFISEDILFLSLGLAKQESLNKLLMAVFEGKSLEVSNTYRELKRDNVDSEKIYHGLLDTIYEAVNNILIDKAESPFPVGPEELMWVYETLAKDIEWALQSFDLGKTLEIILQKVTLRRGVIELQDNATVKKKVTVEIVVPEATPEVAKVEAEMAKEPVKDEEELAKELVKKEVVKGTAKAEEELVKEPVKAEEKIAKDTENIEVKKPLKKDWTTFLSELQLKSPATSSNLEQGNIIDEPSLKGDFLHVALGFPSSAKVFYEYVSNEDVQSKIINEISLFYEISVEKVDLKLNLKQEDKTFKSIANLKDQEIEQSLKEKEKNLLENPHLKMAESLFGSKVDKVVVNKKT